MTRFSDDTHHASRITHYVKESPHEQSQYHRRRVCRLDGRPLGDDRGGCQIVLVDVVDGLAKGKVLDLIQAGPIAGHAIDAIGTTDMAETANSEIVIITAGVARKPGMTREDLVAINAGIVGGVVKEVVKYSPNCVILMMTNPLDTMTYLAYKLSGFPRERVIGQAGVLDGGR